ncbi:hypothetical protein FHS76_003976 [Ochrobactrum daejeonense]|uniref:Uncharacterized protein n=1 Tax=Brucella daejeonensis TaxID=659015 RepID=A0A7W9B102_9HYPH|nr:hypothetical protein [Brucella daejeonensis]MBB5704061.1 hypothetical protein [Brucella daejeonensis]
MKCRVILLYAILSITTATGAVFAADSRYDAEQHKGNDPIDLSERVLQKPFQSTTGSQYGVLGNIGRPVIGGNSIAKDQLLLTEDDLNTLFDEDQGAAARNQILGCGVIDEHAAMVTAMDVKEEQVKDYLNSQLAKYMLTTLYNSPALAAVYDSVESYGAKRVQLMQDRCQAVQSAASLSSEDMMRWQALQECVRRNVGTENLKTGSAKENGEDYRDGKEALAYAAAYRACLYGSQSQIAMFNENGTIKATLGKNEVEFKPSENLQKKSLEQVLETSLLNPDEDELKPSMWTGGLLDALKGTSLCYVKGGGGGAAKPNEEGAKDCAIMAFIPNVRWCVGSERSKQACLNQEKPRLSNALFTPIQVFDIAYALAQNEINYRYTFAENLTELVGYDNAMDIAVKGELLQEPMQEAKVAEQKLTDSEPDTEMTRYFGCSKGYTPEDFSEYITRAYNLKITKNDEDFPALDPEATMVSAYNPSGGGDDDDVNLVKIKDLAEQVGKMVTKPSNLNTEYVMADLKEVNKLAHGDYLGGGLSGASGNPASFFILSTVRCAMESYVRGTLADYVAVTSIDNDGERTAILMAMRTRTAQVATEMLYQFLKEKLSLASIELAYAGPTGSVKATPPHVLRAVENVIALLDNQLNAMAEVQSRQAGFADLISRLRVAKAGIGTVNPAE